MATKTDSIETLAADIREVEGILEMHTADEVIGYLDAHQNAAAECLGSEGHLHASCGNASKADALFALANRAVALA